MIEATCSHTVAEVTVVSKHRVNNVSQVDPVFRSSFGRKHEQGFEEVPLGIGQIG